MTGSTDLAAMLATLEVRRRPEPVAVVSLAASGPGATSPRSLALGDGVLALLAEDEGTTVVATIAEAERRGWTIVFRAAWLTVAVHSSLEAIGLTAALAAALAADGIAANVLAGAFHDHVLVPFDRADDALVSLAALRSRSTPPSTPTSTPPPPSSSLDL